MNGHLVISLDYELLWGLAGWDDEHLKAYERNVDNANDALLQIVKMLEEYGMKLTVAYVGTMNNSSVAEVMDEKNGFNAEYNSSIFSAFNSSVPYAKKANKPSLLFAKDIIGQLKDQSHVELASHTYSHYYCLEDGQTKEMFEKDVELACLNAEKIGLKLRSIILPRNQIQHDYMVVCKDRGITHYRGTLNNWLYKTEKTKSRFSMKGALRFLDTYINISGSNTYSMSEYKDDVLVNVPGSRFLRPFSAKLSFFERLKIKRIKSSMTYAAKHGLVYHLWWHPHNFGANTTENMDNLKSLCEHYLFLKNKYWFNSSTMSEINS